MKPEVKIVQFQKFRSGKGQDSEGELIVEKPVDLYVNGMLWITFMCTPTTLKELVVGFLFNEGVIDSAGQVLEYHICDNQ
jgi:FdhD protein